MSLFSPPVRPICCNTELKLTYNKNRHESSAGYWHCGSNDSHPELEQRMWFLLSSNSISRNPTLPPSLWIHEKTRSEGSGSSARKWREKGLWRGAGRSLATHQSDCCGGREAESPRGWVNVRTPLPWTSEVEISYCSKQLRFSQNRVVKISQT